MRSLRVSSNILASFGIRFQSSAHHAIAKDHVFLAGRQWLHAQTRENCRCPKCWYDFDHHTGEAPIDLNVRVTKVISVTDSAAKLEWSDGHQGVFPLSEIAAFSNGLKNPHNDEHVDIAIPFASRKTFRLDDVLNDPAQRLDCLMDLAATGICRITDAPAEEGHVLDISNKLGFGDAFRTVHSESFLVKSAPEDDQPGNGAYTPYTLPLHTDLPYYSQPPAIFIFHCIKPGESGGESFYADGFWAAEQLKASDPAAFESLSTINIPFRDLQPGWDLRGFHPVIELDASGNLYRIHDNPGVRDTFGWTADIATKKEWYEAYTKFRSIVQNSKNWFEFGMAKGDITIFNNWRLEHSRLAFTGERMMEGCYAEMSHFRSALRLLQERA